MSKETIVLIVISIGLLILGGWFFSSSSEEPDKCSTNQCLEDYNYALRQREKEKEDYIEEFNRPATTTQKFGNLMFTCVQRGTWETCETTVAEGVDSREILSDAQSFVATMTVPMPPQLNWMLRDMGVGQKIREEMLKNGRCIFNLWCPKPTFDEIMAKEREVYEAMLGETK